MGDRQAMRASRTFLPYSAAMFVIALGITVLMSAYGSPVLMFGWLFVTLLLWGLYRLVPDRRAGLLFGIVLIIVAAAQIVFNRDGQIYTLLVVSVDVLFASSEKCELAVVGCELVGFAAFRLLSYPRLDYGAALYTLLIPALVAALLLLYSHSIRQLLRQNARLERQTVVIESLALARERARMASEMHDSIGQSFSAVHLQAEAVQRRVPAEDEALRVSIDSILQISHDGLTQVRQQARALNPAAFGEELTNGSIQALADSFHSTELDVQAVVVGDVAQLPGVEKTVLYRSLQELLTNVVRHAKATRAVVEIRVNAYTVSLRVSDDGSGMPANHTGFGLSSLRSRITAIGGSMHIAPHGSLSGAQVDIIYPIEHDEDFTECAE